jgi:hypothetical protein
MYILFGMKMGKDMLEEFSNIKKEGMYIVVLENMVLDIIMENFFNDIKNKITLNWENWIIKEGKLIFSIEIYFFYE